MLIIILWRGKKMNKKIVFISIIAAVLILLTGITPALASIKITSTDVKNDLITVEVNQYLGRQTEKVQTTITAGEADEIQHYLTELYDAQQRNDQQAIATYEALLNKKGIFGMSYQHFYSNSKSRTLLGKTVLSSDFTAVADENISNRLCYFNAIGEGLVAWWLAIQVLDGIVRLLHNVTSLILALILLLTFLPFFVLTMLFTNLIPFRILSPMGALALKNGTISCLGVNGLQRRSVGAEGYGVNLSWFTGLTISIPAHNDKKSFLFVSGFAFKAEGVPY
jgi:hypothetical protein